MHCFCRWVGQPDSSKFYLNRPEFTYVAFEHEILQKQKCMHGVTVNEGTVALPSHTSW